MGIFKSAGGVFLSKARADFEAVNEKLDAAEAELPALAQRVRETALSAALDSSAGGKHRKAVDAQRQQQQLIESLRLALAEANRIEEERLANVRTKQQQATLRAAKAHLASLVRDAATAKQSTAWQKMAAATESFQTLIGPRWQRDYAEIAESRLIRAGEKELLRVGHRTTNIGPMPWMPGSSASSSITGTPVFQLQPISTVVRDLASYYGDQLARELSLAPPLPPPVEGPDATWRGPDVGTERWYEQREEYLRQAAEPPAPEPPIEPEPTTEEQGDDAMQITDALKLLLGVKPAAPAEPAEPDLPLCPWPIGSPAYVGFMREHERIQRGAETAQITSADARLADVAPVADEGEHAALAPPPAV